MKHYHDEDMQSLSLRSDKPLDPTKFMPWLQELVANDGAKILRSKGILAFKGDDDRYVFQGVHMMLEGDHQRKWKADEKRESRVVFIGRDLPQERIREGQIGFDLSRPVGYPGQLLAGAVGEMVGLLPFLALAFPVALIAGELRAPVSPEAGFGYAVALLLAWVIAAQLNLLKQRASRKKFQAPSPEELAALVKNGDPGCPKGQAYKPKDSKSEVRCTGPQLADMNAEGLKQYYGDRHFKVTSQETPAEVRAEMGSELYVFAFDKLGDPAPRCVTAYAAPGMSWQEVASRLTGTPPERMKLDAPVKSGRGELALAVEHATDKPTVKLGQCGQIVAPP